MALVPEEEKMDLNHKVQALTRMIEKEYRDDADSEWLGEVIDRFHHPDKYKTEEELAAENPHPLPNCLMSFWKSIVCQR